MQINDIIKKDRITVAEAKRLGLFSNKRGKFNNRRTFYKGRWYDSKKEAGRAFELDCLFQAGVITKWNPQPRFNFMVNRVHIGSYIADFEVFYKDGRKEIEDVKGFKTELYKWKKKMMWAFFRIKIIEI